MKKLTNKDAIYTLAILAGFKSNYREKAKEDVKRYYTSFDFDNGMDILRKNGINNNYRDHWYNQFETLASQLHQIENIKQK